MTIEEIHAKMLEGKTLSDEEKAFLKAWKAPEAKADDDKDKGQMIPKSRLDQEIAKRKQAEKEAEEAKKKADELESKDLTEQEKLTKAQEKMQADLAKTAKERDEAIAARTELEFKSRVSELAGKHNFTDAEYLGFLAQKQKIDLNDEAAATGLITSLKKDAPKFFKVETAAGAGSPVVGNVTAADQAAAKVKELQAKPSLTMREASQVIEAQMQQKAATAQPDGAK